MQGGPILTALLTAVSLGAALALASAACEPDPKIKLGITVDEHGAYFPIGTDAIHALGAQAQDGQAIGCDQCHAGQTSFKDALCISCHKLDNLPLESVHATIAGFIEEDASCLTCHPTGVRGDEGGVSIHSQLSFPIDPGDVHGNDAYTARIRSDQTSCTACHASVADRSQNLCKDCHAADIGPTLVEAHAGLSSSFRLDSVSCKECHSETPINEAMHPLSNHSFYDPAHHDAICVNCHEQYLESPKSWAIDFAIGTCTGCHTHPAACNPANQGACN